MLEDYLCSYQTKLEVLSQIKRTTLQNNFNCMIRRFTEALNLLYIKRYKTGITANIVKRGIL